LQTPTLFTIAQDLTKMQIDTNIDEADIGKIKTGQDVEFSVDAYPDNTFRGVVDQIRISPIIVQNVVTYDVVIKVDNADLRLKPGMTANVSVVVAAKDAVLKVPNAALRFRPGEKDGVQPAPAEKAGARPAVASVAKEMGTAAASGKTAGRAAGPKGYGVWVLEDGKPKRVPVTIGISDGSMTEIAAGVLEAGQEVIVESASKSSKNSAAGQSLPRFIR
jgi:HlyD family secretion protein